MKEIRTIKKDRKMPVFTVEFWTKENYEGVIPKRFMKRMWCGVVSHVQTGEVKKFDTITKLLNFMEERKESK